MKSYLIKSKKYTLFIKIIFCIFSFCFIDRVYAYVNKGSDFTGFSSGASFTGTLGNSNSNNSVELRSYFSSPVSTTGYDLLGFPYFKLNFTYTLDYDINTYTCSTYTIDSAFPGGIGGTGDRYYTQLRCTSSSGTNSDILKDGTITISGQAFDTQGHWTQCVYEENPGQLICPVNSLTDVDNIKLIITQSGYKQVDYDIAYFLSKNRYNYESTEIVNALSQLQIQQINTINQIEQTNQYIANNNTTQTQTDSTTALGGLSTEINSHLSDMNELTRFIFLPITFIVGMIDDSCQPLIWDIPLVNTRVVVPCMSSIYGTYFSTFIGIFSTIMTALITYRCCIKLLATIKGVLDAEDDKLEVIDL